MSIKEIFDNSFRGNIYIAQENNILCENVTGYADLANEVPNLKELLLSTIPAESFFAFVVNLSIIDFAPEPARDAHEDNMPDVLLLIGVIVP